MLAAFALLLVPAGPVTIETKPFGTTADGQEVTQYVLANDHGMTLSLIDYGATIQALTVPDRDGNGADVVLGFDEVAGYESGQNPYFGCTVGRYANRIAGGKFSLNGTDYALVTNGGKNHLHGGGDDALSKKVWTGKIGQAKATKTNAKNADNGVVIFRTVSPDGEEGYPGKLVVTVRYVLSADQNTVTIQYEAKTDAPTPVNLTNHSYFNLHGQDGEDIRDHELKVFAAKYTPVDENLIPTGELASVQGTPFDFRKATPIGERLLDAGNDPPGYDLNYVIRRTDERPIGQMTTAAFVFDPDTGRKLTCQTTEPGVQLYTSNGMAGISGKGGATYGRYQGVCLETQHYPDSPNQSAFPSTIVTPDKPYRSRTRYLFRTDADDQ